MSAMSTFLVIAIQSLYKHLPKVGDKHCTLYILAKFLNRHLNPNILGEMILLHNPCNNNCLEKIVLCQINTNSFPIKGCWNTTMFPSYSSNNSLKSCNPNLSHHCRSILVKITRDMWYVTRGGRWTFSQNFGSGASLVWERQWHLTCDMWQVTHEM